ncbi:hypothetical protein SAMN04488134_1251, partial [Amphibacillus marinus]
PTGESVTETSAYAANTSSPIIAVVLGGTAVTLPDAQTLDGIVASAGNTVFTVPETGRYYIAYNVNTTVSLLLGTRLLINGTPNAASTRNPLLSVSSFTNDIIVPLTAGSTITLELFGLLGAATLQAGAGANLTIIRVE